MIYQRRRRSLLSGGFSPASLFAGAEVGSAGLPGTADCACYSERITSGAGTIAGHNDPVGTVRDLIKGIYWNAPSDAGRPLLQISGGLHHFALDGVDDYFQTDQLVITSEALYGSVIFAPQGGPPSGERIISCGNTTDSSDGNSTGRTGLIHRDGTTTNWQAARGTTFTPAVVAVPNNAPAVIKSQFTSGEHRMALNAGADVVVTHATGAFNISRVRIGARCNTSPVPYSDGLLYGWFLIDRALVSSEDANLDTFLGARGGLTI